MNGRTILRLVLFLVIAGTAVALAPQLRSDLDATKDHHPQPLPALVTADRSEISDEQNQDLADQRKTFKMQRQEYLDRLHRAAPDTDWRKMDRDNRARLARERAALRGAWLNEGLDPRKVSVQLDKSGRAMSGDWTEKGSNNLAGRMHVATMLDSTIYAGSAGGIVWRGDLAGDTWTPLNDWLKMDDIRAVEVLPGVGAGTHRLVVYHDGADLFHYTDNDGLTWYAATGLEGPGSWGGPIRGDLMGDAGQTLFLLAREWQADLSRAGVGFYRSADHGVSFQRLQLVDLNWDEVDLWCPRGTAGPGYMIQGNDIYSFDATGALTFEGTLPVSHTSSEVRRTELRGRHDDSTGLDLYAAIALSNGSSVLYAWSMQDAVTNSYLGTAPTTSFRTNSFCISQARHREFYLGGVETYRSAGGFRWLKINDWQDYYSDPETMLHADTPGINTFDVDGTEVALISTDGGLYTSVNGLASVQNISLEGLRISQYYGSYTHREQTDAVFAGSQDQGFQRCLVETGGLLDFTQTISGDYGHLVSGDGGNSVWAVYPGFAVLYPDAVNAMTFRTWNFTVSGQFWLPPLMADPHSPDVCWLGGGSSSGGAHLVELTYNGSSITAIEGTHDFGTPISAMACSPLDPDTRYVLTDGGSFHFSTDGGVSWQVSPGFTGPGAQYFHGASIVASPVDAATVWIGGSGYSNAPVFVSYDRGLSFSEMRDGLPSTLVYDLAVNEDGRLLFAATELGPYLVHTGVGSWQSISGSGAPDQTYWNVDWIENLNTARFTTYGRGIWDFTLDFELPVPDSLPVLAGFDLKAAPNPFNPYSQISFNLPAAARVDLDLYDLRGARISRIFSGELAEGVHEYPFGGRNMASGVYLVRLSVDGQNEELRVTLLK